MLCVIIDITRVSAYDIFLIKYEHLVSFFVPNGQHFDWCLGRTPLKDLDRYFFLIQSSKYEWQYKERSFMN